MEYRKNKIINIINLISTNISSIIIPIFQYVPCTAVWFGIMSVPFIVYLGLFFQNPEILKFDIQFLFRTHGIYFTILGFIIFTYSLIYQLKHRNQLLQKGPYKYVRHPQYIAFILMTFGLSLVSFQTSPITNFDPFYISGYTIIFYVWIAEFLAYIILSKIEEYALNAKYGEEYVNYVNKVPFMFPFLNQKRNKTEKNTYL